MTKSNIRFTFDTDMKVSKWPKKTAEKLLVLKHLYTKFDTEKTYSEKEINQILDEWHTFEDSAVLRRALVDQGFIFRKKDGSEYSINKDIEHISIYKIVS